MVEALLLLDFRCRDNLSNMSPHKMPGPRAQLLSGGVKRQLSQSLSGVYPETALAAPADS
jgi:hypothetical protein